MISRALMILVIISSFPIVNTLQIAPKVVAEAPPPSEGAKVLVEDAIQALNSNDIKKAQMHMTDSELRKNASNRRWFSATRDILHGENI